MAIDISKLKAKETAEALVCVNQELNADYRAFLNDYVETVCSFKELGFSDEEAVRATEAAVDERDAASATKISRIEHIVKPIAIGGAVLFVVKKAADVAIAVINKGVLK